jgi:hypothetical protein
MHQIFHERESVEANPNCSQGHENEKNVLDACADWFLYPRRIYAQRGLIRNVVVGECAVVLQLLAIEHEVKLIMRNPCQRRIREIWGDEKNTS